jgi:hypothetical protein
MPEWWKLWEVEGTSTTTISPASATAETMATAEKPEKARMTEKAKTPANHEFWGLGGKKLLKWQKNLLNAQLVKTNNAHFKSKRFWSAQQLSKYLKSKVNSPIGV